MKDAFVKYTKKYFKNLDDYPVYGMGIGTGAGVGIAMETGNLYALLYGPIIGFLLGSLVDFYKIRKE